jgi:nicotinate phosphoribosyltransferase
MTPLLTDFYELTMIQGYYLENRNPYGVFDMFFRKQPFGGGFSIFTGLEELINILETLAFQPEDLEFLKEQGIFRDSFLEYLKDFHFTGDLYAMKEGTVIFPGEPLIRVHAPLIQAQLVESLLLNRINFQTLIATKTARVTLAADGKGVLEFGLRRAHGPNGALSASRAAFIGGVAATSNTLAGKHFGIPVSGTMAHSWVMAFDSELEAFRRYAKIYPEKCVLLIDTYDTLKSGVENAIIVGKELKEKGHRLGIRLDSGDLEYLSKEVRKQLDENGLEDAFIAVSNDLNENIIAQLIRSGSPIDLWGVGTQLITGAEDAAFSGVYKMSAREEKGKFIPTMKLSDNPEKMSNPGIKQVYRFYDKTGHPCGDLITLEEENINPDQTITFYHPMYEYTHITVSHCSRVEPLLEKVMQKGKRVSPSPSLDELQQRTRENLSHIPERYTRLINPHIYKVSLSETLKTLKFRMIDDFTSQHTETY